MIIKRTIKFSIQNQRNAGSRLRMRVSYNGCRVDFQTGIVLNKEYWDDVQQRVLPLNSNVAMATDRNDQLLQMLTDMIAVFREYELRNVVPTVPELRESFAKQRSSHTQTAQQNKNKDRTLIVQQVDKKGTGRKIRAYGSILMNLSKSMEN